MIENRHVPRAGDIDTVLLFAEKNEQLPSRTSKFEYYVIRCQRRALETRRRLLLDRYPNARILEPECDDANALHCWNRFKQEVLSRDDYLRNHFNVPDYELEVFEDFFVLLD